MSSFSIRHNLFHSVNKLFKGPVSQALRQMPENQKEQDSYRPGLTGHVNGVRVRVCAGVSHAGGVHPHTVILGPTSRKITMTKIHVVIFSPRYSL